MNGCCAAPLAARGPKVTSLTHRYEVPDFARTRPRTRIVCTMGPATDTVEKIKALIRAGMSVARLNLVHETLDKHVITLAAVRRAASELGVSIGVLADLPGPKYRTGPLASPNVTLDQGATFVLTVARVTGDQTRVSVEPPGLHRDVRPSGRILIDDGAVEMRVDRIEGEEIFCTVTGAGQLKPRKGVAAPGHTSTLDYFTADTVKALEFVRQNEVEFVGLSYIRTAADLQRVRSTFGDSGRSPQLIAKIEIGEAVTNLKEILAASDGVMVARGDLGVEMPLEVVPRVQKEIIRAANDAGKVVITATQMLESMIHAPNPTRAEATDVHNAVLDGTDAIMLSAETSIGDYPVRAVEYMGRIARQAETALDYRAMQDRRFDGLGSRGPVAVDEAIAYSACRTAETLGATVILAFTESGSTASRVASFRPPVPVLALTRQPAAGARLSLRWGVLPIMAPRIDSLREMFFQGSVAALQTGYGKHGELAVAVVGVPIGIAGNTNLLRVIRLPEPEPKGA